MVNDFRTTRHARPRVSGAAVALTAVLAVLMVAEPAAAQTLDSLVRAAIAAHPGVAARQLAIRQADASARSASAWEAPSVGIDLNMVPPTDPNPLDRGETMLMVQQMIPLFGQNRAMAVAREVGAEVAGAGLAELKRDLRARVEPEYYTLWMLERREEIQRTNLRLLDVLARSVEAHYTVGGARQSDQLSIRIESERAETAIEEIALERSGALARLNALLDRPADTPVDPVDTLAPGPLPALTALTADVDSNPGLQMKSAQSKMALAEADAAERMLDPMLMLSGSIAYMPQGHPVRQAMLAGELTTPMGVSHVGISAGAMITLPFMPWSRQGPEARGEAFRLEAQQHALEKDAMRLDLLARLRTTYAEAQRADYRLSFYRDQQLPLLEQTLETARTEYAAGTSPFTTVLDTWRMLVMTRLDAYTEQLHYALAVSTIDEITDDATGSTTE